MKVTRSDSTSALRYFHKDHLGSISVITDDTGAVVERLSYDASKRSLAPPRRASGASPTTPKWNGGPQAVRIT
ncbi:MAG: hypothetical protein NW223_21965 [Hyphomicrobiaceae bacterium]|nr:hypothetical protein [Hyphomicrobiaceae bacterium]